MFTPKTSPGYLAGLQHRRLSDFLRSHAALIRRRLYAIDSVLHQFLDCRVSTTPINDRCRSREIVDPLDSSEFRESRDTRGRSKRARNSSAIAIPPPGRSCSPGNREPTKSEVGTIDYTLERDESENGIDICRHAIHPAYTV